MAILYIIIVGNVREFEEIRQICFTANERYYLYVFLFTKDILIFYITYELMIGLVFYIMYLSANNRGGIEAILFFLG